MFVVIAVLISSLYLALGTLQAAKHLHSQMLSHVLMNPLSFFDTTPTGRILNRFNKDIDTLDNTIPYNIRAWLNCLLSVMITFCNILLTNKYSEKKLFWFERSKISVRFEVMSIQSEIWYLVYHKHVPENTVLWDVMSRSLVACSWRWRQQMSQNVWNRAAKRVWSHTSQKRTFKISLISW